MYYCTDGQGYRTAHPAEGWLCAPDGRRVTAQCRKHAEEIILEYQRYLNEAWTFRPVLDALAAPTPERHALPLSL